VIHALMEVVGEEGTILMPTFNPAVKILPPLTTPSAVGKITKAFRKREGVRFENFFVATIVCSPSRAPFPLRSLWPFIRIALSNSIPRNPYIRGQRTVGLPRSIWGIERLSKDTLLR